MLQQVKAMNNMRFKSAVLSGVLIGIGNIINLTIENHYIGAALFSFALLTIINNNLPLYTGKIGFIEKYSLKDFAIILLGNLLGVAIIMAIVMSCKSNLHDMMVISAETKFSNDILSTFLLSFMCGILMFIAVYSKNTVITVFCIMIFILSGYKHCIADFPYALINLNAINMVKFLCIILGNSLGAILTHKLID